MKFCQQINKHHRIFYDPVSNQFLLNGQEPLYISLTKEYEIIDLVEQSEIAGLSQDEILYAISSLIFNSQPSASLV